MKRFHADGVWQRPYLRKKKHLGIGYFIKKCRFLEQLSFLNLDQKCQKQLLIRGDSTSTLLLAGPSALLLNKGALLLK